MACSSDVAKILTLVPDRQADHASASGEHDALGEQLAHDCAASAAERDARRDSGARVAPRASSNPAMFTQPMRSTMPTADQRIISGSRTWIA